MKVCIAGAKCKCRNKSKPEHWIAKGERYLLVNFGTKVVPTNIGRREVDIIERLCVECGLEHINGIIKKVTSDLRILKHKLNGTRK